MGLATHVQHLHSNTITNGQPQAPSANDLLEGEIAINYADGHETMFIKNDNNEIVSFSDNSAINSVIDALC